MYVPELVRGDAKDHPNFGQNTPELRGDAKDHPNFGQITPNDSSVGTSRSVVGTRLIPFPRWTPIGSAAAALAAPLPSIESLRAAY